MWNYTSGIPASQLGSGAIYKVIARAYDTAGNNQLSSEITFSGDVDNPDTVLVIPDAALYPGGMDYFDWQFIVDTDISGTASDNTAGIDEVRFYIENITQGGFYNSSADPPDFSGGSPEWLLAGGTTDWFRHISTTAWTSGATYEVVVRA